MSDSPSIGDALTEFSAELNALIERWSKRTGGRCDMTVRPTIIDEPPIEGFEQIRRGPLVEISLTVIDVNCVGDLLAAYFPAPAAVRAAIERIEQQTSPAIDRADSGCPN